jgi:hypothetical protein
VKKMPNLADLSCFPYFPASSMAFFMFDLLLLFRCKEFPTGSPVKQASRRCGVAVSALFSVIFNLWRWLFTLLGGG